MISAHDKNEGTYRSWYCCSGDRGGESPLRDPGPELLPGCRVRLLRG